MDRDYWIDRPKFYSPEIAGISSQVYFDWWSRFQWSDYEVCGC